MEIVPEDIGWRETYKLMIGAIVPRPIAFVSTVNERNERNLAAFSFFNAVCPSPFVVSFAPMRRPADLSKKDTLNNIEATGQFVINLVSEDIVDAMNLTAPEYPASVDEFEISGFTPIPSIKVAPPRVMESKIHLECELLQILEFGQEPGTGSLVLGKVVQMHISDEILVDGKIDVVRYKPVARMAGDDYLRSTDRFELKRPSFNQ